MTAIIGYGTTLGYSTDSGSTYTTLTLVREISGPDEVVGEAKTTHLASTNAAHEYIAGLIEAGECSFKLLFDKTLYTSVRTLRNVRTTYYWKITLPDGTSQGSTLVFQGHIKKMGLMSPMEEAVEMDMSVKCTGRPTFTAGT